MLRPRVDAERFLASVETTKLRGTYVDPDAGRITLSQFSEDWAVDSCGRATPIARCASP